MPNGSDIKFIDKPSAQHVQVIEMVIEKAQHLLTMREHISGLTSSELKCYLDLLKKQREDQDSDLSRFLDKLKPFLEKIKNKKGERLQENKSLQDNFDGAMSFELSRCILENSELITEKDAKNLLELERKINGTVQEALANVIESSELTVRRSQIFPNLLWVSLWVVCGEVRFPCSTDTESSKCNDGVRGRFFEPSLLGSPSRSRRTDNNLAKDQSADSTSQPRPN